MRSLIVTALVVGLYTTIATSAPDEETEAQCRDRLFKEVSKCYEDAQLPTAGQTEGAEMQCATQYRAISAECGKGVSTRRPSTATK
jgi:hypothetical protein